MPSDHRLRRIAAPYANEVQRERTAATATGGGSKKPPRRPRTKTGGSRGYGGDDGRGPKGPAGNAFPDFPNGKNPRKKFTPPKGFIDRPSPTEKWDFPTKSNKWLPKNDPDDNAY